MSTNRTLFTAALVCVIASSVFANDTITKITPSKTTSSVIAATPVKQININQAKAKDLLNVKGLTPASARAIVAYRKRHGAFKSLNDLAKVRVLKKMNPADLQAIQAQLSV